MTFFNNNYYSRTSTLIRHYSGWTLSSAVATEPAEDQRVIIYTSMGCLVTIPASGG